MAVLKHELRIYFNSLTAYVFGAFLLASDETSLYSFSSNPVSILPI
jgi:hypothetical protein